MRKLIVILIILSLVAKVFLLGKGYLSSPDEFRHIYSQNAIEYLRKGEVKQAAKQLFDVQGRPGLTLVGMVPAAFQNVIANALKVGYNGIEAAWVIYIFNFVIFLTILFLIFRIALLFSIPDKIALLVVLLYSVSINGYIYLRHVFPYDFSLMLLLFALWYLLMNKLTLSYLRSFIFGILISGAFIIYPGYFPLALAFTLFYILIIYSKDNLSKLIRHSLVSGLGGVLLIIGLELLAQFCGTSYLLDAKQLSTTITQGSFEESFSFILKYLWQAEFPLGIVYLFSLVAGSVFLVKRVKKDKNEHLIYLFLSLFIGFVIYASLGQFFHKMVFYGRLVHQFYPFMAILFGYVLYKLIEISSWPKGKVSLFAGITIVLLSLPNHLAFARVYYPREILSNIKKYETTHKMVSYCERQAHLDNSQRIKSVENSDVKHILHLVNFCYPTGPDIPGDFKKFNPSDSTKLLFTFSHFINLPSYQFEGGNIRQREEYQINPLFIRAYKQEMPQSFNLYK